MGHSRRLERVEAVLDTGPNGNRCRDCRGVTIDQILNALNDQKHPDSEPRQKNGEAVLAALEAGTDKCERCGAPTLAGYIREHLIGVPDDLEMEDAT